MKESYRKGVANHPDPEPCGGSSNAAPEALDRGRCRLGIHEVDEAPKKPIQWRRRCQANRKAKQRRALSQVRQHGGVEDPMHALKLHAREPRDPVAIHSRRTADRWEKAMSYKTHMHGGRSRAAA